MWRGSNWSECLRKQIKFSPADFYFVKEDNTSLQATVIKSSVNCFLDAYVVALTDVLEKALMPVSVENCQILNNVT